MLELVERLLAAGADPAAANDDGTTAAELAAAGGHAELAARLADPRRFAGAAAD